jgi:outer membrane lipoprotein-sorting protein
MRRHPLAVLLTLVGLFGLVAIASAAIGGGEKPRKRTLATAVHRALTAPAVQGVTARIRFTNSLIGAEALGAGTSPLLSGASGRAWVAKDGRFRLELQAEGGDSQVVNDGRRLTVYDADSNTLYTAKLPRERKAARHDHTPPTLADVRTAIKRVARYWTLAGPKPTNVAGEPAYAVSASPKRHGGLLGAAGVAWDAARGTPLSFSITAKGASKPVLKLAATDISYGRVDAGALKAPNPPGAKKQAIALPVMDAHGGARKHRPQARAAYAKRIARETKAARAALGDGFAAPKVLAGRKRYVVELKREKGEAPKAIVLYGEGLGGIAVLEERAAAGERAPFRGLGKATVDGVTGGKLETALGTLVTWHDGTTRYTLLGSMPGKAAEAAANALR